MPPTPPTSPTPPTRGRPRHWPGLELRGPAAWLDEAEGIVCAALESDELLGTARLTWRLEGTLPAAAVAALGDDPASLRIYLAPDADAADCAARIEHALASIVPASPRSWSLVPLSTPDADWATAWRDYFRPVAVSERLAVLPAWWDRADGLRLAGVADAPDAVVLRIEPGQAFGSGTHATTRLCLRLMDRILRERAGGRLLDFGTGSGILSFAALALGAEAVVAVEIDPDTAENFRANARLNETIMAGRPLENAVVGAGRPLDHRIGSAETLGPADRFETIVCNALFDRVSASLPGAAAHLEPGGIFIYSGYLLADRDEVMAFFADRLGLTVREEAGEEEWGALVADGR
jgi:ribosomal protein L11 methyltransferase